MSIWQSWGHPMCTVIFDHQKSFTVIFYHGPVQPSRCTYYCYSPCGEALASAGLCSHHIARRVLQPQMHKKTMRWTHGIPEKIILKKRNKEWLLNSGYDSAPLSLDCENIWISDIFRCAPRVRRGLATLFEIFVKADFKCGVFRKRKNIRAFVFSILTDFSSCWYFCSYSLPQQPIHWLWKIISANILSQPKGYVKGQKVKCVDWRYPPRKPIAKWKFNLWRNFNLQTYQDFGIQLSRFQAQIDGFV